MAWVRYDDQFYNNRKVTAVIAERVENVAALGLHALANTWSSGQRWPGFVPRHQPNILVCDRERGTEWADVLVQHRLWHDVSDMCDACQEEYAHLPEGLDGFVFHNAREYRPADRERTTPGTPADLSEKRREAGRRGGRASAAKRNQTNGSTSKQNEANGQQGPANQANSGHSGSEPPQMGGNGDPERSAGGDGNGRPAETQQTARANQANGASKPSNLLLAGVSPVPVPEVVASNEATVPPTAGAPAPPRDRPLSAGDVVAAYMDGARTANRPQPTDVLRKRIGKRAGELIRAGKTAPQALLNAGYGCGWGGWQDLDVQLQRDVPGPARAPVAALPARDSYDASKVFGKRNSS